MLSLFIFLKTSLAFAILFAVFSAFLMTGKSNIKDMYLWSGKKTPSKYQDIVDFVNDNETSNDLVEFENRVKTRDGVDYLIYKVNL